ncbi:LPS biosynthesis protein [Capnocytophaga sp. H4358]|uniref:N-acetyl sugar amidotransferase n=1 Tax=Capnocytophaga sp. H4358 TaxID=1945658 RepID=UPI000BB16EE8|nr:N-acetyl sugar amidotransferase [Capnocytophaga sp. H4358]ATA72671.1 LPS biosynthesis protein [Capnocytophaga sp. H4358]
MSKKDTYQICTNCVMDTSDLNIKFDEKGVCERCNEYYENILPDWQQGKGKQKELNELVAKIKKEGQGKPYDCLLGMSGGFDSSYMLHFAIKELELRPLVFHVDAGWNTPFAEENITKMVKKLGIDLKVEKINWNEERDFQLAFFKSGVPHLDIPQDLAFVSVLDNYAKKNKIKYVLNGGNISTEVIVNPNSWGYWGTDMKHNRDIIRKFGTVPMDTYPFTNVFNRKILMPYLYGVKVVKLLNYVPYIKKEAEVLLQREYGWTPYPQKHFESYMTKFIEGYWLPERFGYDVRRPQFSSLILTGQMTREEAIDKLATKPISEEEVKELFEKIASMLEISTEELKSYMDMPLKTYKDYKHQDYLFDLGARIMYWVKLDKLIRK